MPSFLSKLSNKTNPYMNAYLPGHNPIPKPPSTRTTASCGPRSQSQAAFPPQALPPGSSAFLAQARQSAGRNAVNARRRSASDGRATGERTPLAELRQVEDDERTAYQSRAGAVKRTTGSRYELFAQESRARREEEARVRAARGGVEYYAPERRLQEFYAGGVGDW